MLGHGNWIFTLGGNYHMFHNSRKIHSTTHTLTDTDKSWIFNSKGNHNSYILRTKVIFLQNYQSILIRSKELS